MRFTFETVACLGTCLLAPCVFLTNTVCRRRSIPICFFDGSSCTCLRSLAFSRSYSYTFQRPLHYLFYATVAAFFGGFCWLLVNPSSKSHSQESI